MKTKTYRANTNISINVVLASKKNLHISFLPQSDGSSVFVTSNEEIQKAIERHYKFGSLFRLVGTTTTETKKPTTAQTDKKPATTAQTATTEEKPAPANETNADTVDNVGEESDNDAPANDVPEVEETESAEENEQEQQTLREVEVSDIAAAKDYLADNFDLTRSSMRSQKAVLDAAAAHGIQFKFLS